MDINRRDTLKLFGFAAISPLSFLHQNKDIVWGPVEDYKELSKRWKLKTNIVPPTDHKEQYCILGKNTLLLKPINLPGEYQISAFYIEENPYNKETNTIIEYIWSLFYDKKEEDKIHEFNDKIYDYNINTERLQYVDIARDLSYCCHNMYGCMGKQCDCKTRFFKENNHWASCERLGYVSKYSLKWLGFKNHLIMTTLNFRTESKKDFIIL